MRNKRIATVLFLIIFGMALLGGGYRLGYVAGEKHPQNLVIKGVANIDNQGTSADFSTFWQAWSVLNNEFLNDSKIKNQTKVYGAISGLMDSLGDPYSVFFNPQDAQQFQEDVQGTFSGIGAQLGIDKGQLVIIAPLKESPAMKIGLKAGDKILNVDATSTDGMNVDQAVRIIRGPDGTNVKLNILRDGWDKPKDFVITRAPIMVPTLDFEMKDNIAHISLYSFNINSSPLFAQAVSKARSANAKGMVLDLRNDPGGYLEVAVDLAGWFIKRGDLVVSEEGRDGQVFDQLKAAGNEALVNFPTVVLINKGSASAAEILAGALRDKNHVKLVGEQSFGKGTVQKLENLKDGSSIKVTIAHWVLPSGGVLENGGLKPDYEVKVTDDDTKAGRDPQLDKALEVVKGMIK